MSLIYSPKLTQYRGHVIEAAPEVEPVTGDELRSYLRGVTETMLPNNDANDLISEAREMIEENTGLALITQSWTLALDCWPQIGREPWWDGVRDGAVSELTRGHGDVVPPRYPLQGITSVTTYDESDDATAVVVADTFNVDIYRKPGRMGLKNSATWPTALRNQNAIVIVYVAGYGDAASDVPAALKRAVKQAAAYLYENRGDSCCVADALSSVSGILDQYKVARI